MTVTLSANKLTLKYGERTIANQLSLSFLKPEIVSIIGPNGSGKTTLLKSLCRLLTPDSGSVYLNSKDINKMSAKEVSKKISVMAQSAQAPAGITVGELISYGRIPYQQIFSSLNIEDKKIIEEAIEFTELKPLLNRYVNTLSGGERQRAWLAMALAQEPKILLLDEPTTYLDVHHQLELMELVVKLHKLKKITIIMVLHDLNHAARYSQRLIAIKNGEIVADGSVEEVFSKEIIENLYDVKTIITHPCVDGITYPVCIPYNVI